MLWQIGPLGQGRGVPHSVPGGQLRAQRPCRERRCGGAQATEGERR